MERVRRGPLLGIAAILALWGVMMFALAVFRTSRFVFDRALVAFLIALVSWIIAARLYSTWLELREDGD